MAIALLVFQTASLSSAATPPTYIFSTFTGDHASDMLLRIYTSADGTNFTLYSDSGYGGPTGSLRDPSIMKYNGRYYVVFTAPPYNRPYANQNFVGLAWSTNLVDWHTMPSIYTTNIPGVKLSWAPEWVVGNSGLPEFTVNCSSASSDLRPYLYTATSSGLTNWSGPVDIGIGSMHLDTQVLKVGNTWHCFTKSNFLQEATAPSITGPWTWLPDRADWANLEGPCAVQLTNGSWVMYVDPMYDVAQYLTSPDLTNWSPLIYLPGPGISIVKHGTVIRDDAFNLPPDGPVCTASVTVRATGPAKNISPDLFGIFFEDLNYAADGGLYAELVRNRSFEFSAEDHPGWNDLTGWEFVERNGGKGSEIIKSDSPLNPNNPHYAVLGLQKNIGAAGLRNSGFDGIPLKAGEKYNFSVFARQLAGPGGPLVVRLETKDGGLLAESKLPLPSSAWVKYQAVLEPANTDADARLVLLTTGEGQVGVDMVSLFPQKTFHEHPNGLRADLARVIAGLHPKFVRFPGGCLVHGDGLDNIYNWKNTIGPVEQRKGQRNIWDYHQSVGLGFYEYFQFCEDIGAKPLPVVSAGVCCQNSGHSVTQVWEKGQRGLAMSDMPAYIQDVLDLIEWANGPTNSTWGAIRAAAGHPAPFHLQYLGIGNEDKQTEVFRERFKMIYDVVKAKHPEITIVGTVGPSPSGQDFTEGWEFAKKLIVDMVDEHYYQKPEWFLDNLHRYDHYNRAGPKVYVGEYASRGNSLFNALAEAAYLTSLERNGDVVRMASYAPLLCKEQHMNWRPDLIYFNNTEVCPSVNYYVQQLFSQNQGGVYLPVEISMSQSADARQGESRGLVVSCIRDRQTGEVILKLVNITGKKIQGNVNLVGIGKLEPMARQIVLAGDPKAENTFAKPRAVFPVAAERWVENSFTCELPAYSLTILRMKTK